MVSTENKFVHCPPVPLVELTTKTINGKRHYVTEKGNYVSITSLLGEFNKKSIFEWRKRVGEEEANRISSTASSRGTRVHTLCELYLKNQEIDRKKHFPDTLSSFYTIKPLLDNINNIHYLEAPLYSNQLKVAGRTDCIGEYDGVLSIIDFKTSLREKEEDWIQSYFHQAAFYACAYYELTGIKISQIVIIIAVDDGMPQLFIKPVKDYIKPMINKVKYFYENIYV
jgi:genome maintenance exonuclease 1